MPTKANCDTASTLASSPSNQAAPATSPAQMPSSEGAIGTWSMKCRRRHTSQAEIGAITKPWAKVSERSQMPTMARKVSRYQNSSHSSPSASTAR
jgi:hypothetical protein